MLIQLNTIIINFLLNHIHVKVKFKEICKCGLLQDIKIFSEISEINFVLKKLASSRAVFYRFFLQCSCTARHS